MRDVTEHVGRRCPVFFQTARSSPHEALSRLQVLEQMYGQLVSGQPHNLGGGGGGGCILWCQTRGGGGEDAYFDVKVFHPYASSYQSRTPANLFQTHETRKRLEYEDRIVNVDHGSFTSLVFSSTGSAGPMADTFLQRLAGKLSEKDGVSYSSTIAWLRCRFSFALLRGSILCIRGSRSRKRCPTHHSEWELAIVESRLDLHLRPTQNMESWQLTQEISDSTCKLCYSITQVTERHATTCSTCKC